MNVFERSWLITKLSFAVINKDRELLWFAFLSFIFSTLFSVAMVVPSVLPALMENGIAADALTTIQYVLVFVTYFGLAFIATFFNVCVVYTAKVRFQGGNATFGESIAFAFSRIGLIVQWSLLSATIGLLLRLLDQLASRLGKIGEIVVRIIIAILGMAWSIVTVFVVPVLVFEGLGPFDSIKRSIEVLKKTWGESLIKAVGIGLVQFLVVFALIATTGGIAYLVGQTFGVLAVAIVVGVGLLLILLAGLIFQVASSIYNTALYLYANNHTVAAGFSEEIVSTAFKRK